MDDVQVGEHQKRNKKSSHCGQQRIDISPAKQAYADERNRGNDRAAEGVAQRAAQNDVAPERRADALVPSAEDPPGERGIGHVGSNLVMCPDHIGIRAPRAADDKRDRHHDQGKQNRPNPLGDGARLPCGVTLLEKQKSAQHGKGRKGRGFGKDSERPGERGDRRRGKRRRSEEPRQIGEPQEGKEQRAGFHHECAPPIKIERAEQKQNRDEQECHIVEPKGAKQDAHGPQAADEKYERDDSAGGIEGHTRFAQKRRKDLIKGEFEWNRPGEPHHGRLIGEDRPAADEPVAGQRRLRLAGEILIEQRLK